MTGLLQIINTMSINSIVALPTAAICMIFLLAYVPMSAHSTYDYSPGRVIEKPHFSEQDIIDRLNNISSIIDINYTPEVGRRIKEYTVNYRVSGEKILGRVNLYFPIIEKYIQEKNLPDDLKYVAIVESNLDPRAMSKSGASGLWQFIKSTGKMQGLEINNTIDERRDPEKSTEAALEYLSYLYEKFDDWTLALAAYNCGPGNIRKAIRRSGGKTDYWSIRKHLPNETQKYIPRIIAAMYLMKYYHAHDLRPEIQDADLRNTIKINDGIGHNFRKLSETLGLDYKTLIYLNPKYSKTSFPQNNGRHDLVIPASRKMIYLANYNHEEYARLREQRLRTEKELLAIENAKSMRKPLIDALVHIDGISYPEVYSRELNDNVNIAM